MFANYVNFNTLYIQQDVFRTLWSSCVFECFCLSKQTELSLNAIKVGEILTDCILLLRNVSFSSYSFPTYPLSNLLTSLVDGCGSTLVHQFIGCLGWLFTQHTCLPDRSVRGYFSRQQLNATWHNQQNFTVALKGDGNCIKTSVVLEEHGFWFTVNC